MLSPTNWRRASGCNEAVASMGLDGLRPHDLRHTFASLARNAGADLKVVSKTMGHSSIRVTADVYIDLFDDELDDVADKLDALLDRSQLRARGPSRGPTQDVRCRASEGN